MVLHNRDRNIMDGSGKRKKEQVVDLTAGSEDEAPAPKSQKTAADFNARQSKSNARQTAPAYQTPPASSLPRSSQTAASSRGGYESVYDPSPSLADHQHSEAERNSWLADDGDINEIVQSTQAAAADTEELVRYGDLSTKVVGVRYYTGHANPGEQILMRREPGNPYDRNAIRIDNVAGVQIGHIPRKIAEKLSKFIDNSVLHVEGELAGRIGEFDCPLTVHMYGPDPQASEEGVQLAAEMKDAKLPMDGLKQRDKDRKEAEKRRQKEEKQRLAEARRAAAMGGTGKGNRPPMQPSANGWVNQSQPGPSSQPVMDDILEASQRINPREIGRSTDDYGLQEEALKNMPSAKKPSSVQTAMLPYQLQALKWLLDHEGPELPSPGEDNSVQLWNVSQRERGLYTNIATNFSTKDKPKLASGGILADDMGLGKTLEMIALLVADNEKAGRKTGTTLIVAPLSVMSNWSGQIAQHLHADKTLKVYVYHGSGRVDMREGDFSQHDVVITTYQTLASDYMPRGKSGKNKQPERQLRSSGLYSVHWRRVILDEGHTVRNPASKGAAAVCALTARSRWVLTGTPIVNSLRDLYSILKFIGVTGGLEQLEMFNRVLTRPLKQGDPSAGLLLKAIMRAFTLRRRKDMAFIDLRLPKLDEYVHRIDFTNKERKRYDALNAEAQGQLSHVEESGQLCTERVSKLLAQLEKQKTVDLTPENQKALQDILQVRIESQEECSICLEFHDLCITTCGHSFGRDCISKVIEIQHKCPMCRAELKDDTRLVSPANDCGDEAADDEMDLTQSSSKLEGLMQILAATKSGDKTIVFSQWTKFLNIVQSRLERDGYKFCRLDGTMSAPQRDVALQSLQDDPKCTIMLASLGVCAVGLNLTAANQIILSDTWWAPAIEDQAVDRVHRLGQKKETRVFRLVMENSIEEMTILVQKEKRKLMKLAFSERDGKRDQVTAGRLADIQMLLRGPAPATGDQADTAETSSGRMRA